MATVFQLIQNTQRPFTFTVTGDGTVDLTTVVTAYVYAHRNVTASSTGTVETWSAVTWAASGANAGTATVTPQASGVGSLLTAGETIKARLMLTFSGAADLATKPQITLSVVEE